jgi:hypothetical protein
LAGTCWWRQRGTDGRLQETANIRRNLAEAQFAGDTHLPFRRVASVQSMQDIERLLLYHASMGYHLLGVLAEDGQVTGVADWTEAAAGDPRADLARPHLMPETALISPGPLRPLFGSLRDAIAESAIQRRVGQNRTACGGLG